MAEILNRQTDWGEIMKAEEKKWVVYWYGYTNHTYMYGSVVDFHSVDDVEYKNALIPPGTVIKTWKSQAKYQMERVEPTLPIIDGEESYRIHLDVDMDIPNGLMLRFRFYQKNGTAEGTYILRGTDGVFRCPIRTYYYDVELIEAGAHHFHFHSMTLEEVREDEEDLLYEKQGTLSKRNKKNTRIHP
ncbi:MAG: accessory Sec system protein Asp3 [Lachnospiraceae bacterium]|nr:accessory Sec system protein Asp3 [Lachnospiraceae bacterium]